MFLCYNFFAMTVAAVFIACVITLGSAQHPNRDAAKTNHTPDADPEPTITVIDNGKADPEQTPPNSNLQTGMQPLRQPNGYWFWLASGLSVLPIARSKLSKGSSLR